MSDLIQFNFDEIVVDNDTLEEELKIASGLGSTSRGSNLWYTITLGRQIIRIVPFLGEKDGNKKWGCWVTLHVHAPRYEEVNGKRVSPDTFISPNAEALSNQLREQLPGWQMICIKETFNKKCPVCEAKWELGKWLKENTPEGWKHPALQRNGLWAQPKMIAWVLPLQHAGTWLETDEGRAWIEKEQKKILKGKAARKGIAAFAKGVEDAKERAISLKEGNDTGIYLCNFGKDLQHELETLVTGGVYNITNLTDPLNGLQLILETTINPDTGFRQTVVTPHTERVPLVYTKTSKGKIVPDREKTNELLNRAWDLYKYRTTASAEIERAMNERLQQIIQETKEECGGGDGPVAGSMEQFTQLGSYLSKKSEQDSSESVGVDMQPTTNKGKTGLPQCYRQGVQNPANPICRKCEVEINCENVESESTNVAAFGPEETAPF